MHGASRLCGCLRSFGALRLQAPPTPAAHALGISSCSIRLGKYMIIAYLDLEGCRSCLYKVRLAQDKVIAIAFALEQSEGNVQSLRNALQDPIPQRPH